MRPSEEWVKAITAIEEADSVSVDPHKLGYVPYPAGAFLLKDRRARELVAVDPPYLALPNAVVDEMPMLGRFIFEGSKPGAAAAAVWLSHRTMPLNNTAHGKLIASTVSAAHRLHDNLGSPAFAPFEVITLPKPDINIVCFFLRHDELESLDEVNALNESIYETLSSSNGDSPEYVISRTRLTSPAYDGAVAPLLARIGARASDDWKRSGSAGLVVLRATVMNPFAAGNHPDHMEGLASAIREVATVVLEKLQPGARLEAPVLARV